MIYHLIIPNHLPFQITATQKKKKINYKIVTPPPHQPMAKPTTTAYLLLITAIFVAALPCITGQLPPASAPMPVDLAPSPGVDCFTYLIKLSDCLTFVETGSNLTKPDPGCCPELGNLVDTQPICLCQLLGNPGQVGISVDVDKALKLPSVCNVTTPPVSLCAGTKLNSKPTVCLFVCFF